MCVLLNKTNISTLVVYLNLEIILVLNFVNRNSLFFKLNALILQYVTRGGREGFLHKLKIVLGKQYMTPHMYDMSPSQYRLITQWLVPCSLNCTPHLNKPASTVDTIFATEIPPAPTVTADFFSFVFVIKI